MIQYHIDKLGHEGKDKVTGIEGVIESVGFDLYGCIQYCVRPKQKEDAMLDAYWLDVTRVVITSDNPVMNQPDFEAGYVAEGNKGPAMKPTL